MDSVMYCLQNSHNVKRFRMVGVAKTRNLNLAKTQMKNEPYFRGGAAPQALRRKVARVRPLRGKVRTEPRSPFGAKSLRGAVGLRSSLDQSSDTLRVGYYVRSRRATNRNYVTAKPKERQSLRGAVRSRRATNRNVVAAIAF